MNPSLLRACFLMLALAAAAHAEPLPHGAVARLGTLRWQHGDAVSAVAWTPDGQTLVAAGSDGVVRLWDQGKARRHRSFRPHKEESRGLAITPDGKLLITASVDRTLRFWDLASLREVRAIENKDDGFEHLALSPDGKTVATAGRDGAVVLRSVASGETQHRLIEHKSGVAVVAFSPDGKTLASGGWDRRVLLWDVDKGNLIRELKGHDDYVEALAYSHDGKTLASGGKDGTIRLWEAATGRSIRAIETGQVRIWNLLFGPDDKLLYAGADGKAQGMRGRRARTLAAWDWKSGKIERELAGHGTVDLLGQEGESDFKSPFKGTSCLAVSPDGKTLASGGADRRLCVWELATGKDTRSAEGGHEDWVTDVSFSPDGRRLASAGRDQSVHVWDVRTGKELHALPRHEAGYTCVRFLPGGLLAAGCGDGLLLLWDAATGKEVRRWKTGQLAIGAVACSADGKRLATASFDPAERTLRLWEPSTGKEEGQFRYAEGSLRALAIAPDGQGLAAVHTEEGLLRWDLDTGKTLKTISCHPDTSLLLFLSGGRLFTGKLGSGEWGLWDAATGKTLKEGEPLADGNLTLGLSPDGRTLTLGTISGEVRLWELATGRKRRTLAGHLGPITALDGSADGRWLATASTDQTILIWDRLAPRADAPPRPDEAILGRAWADLAGDDAEKVYDALCLMASHPKPALEFLQANVRPVSGVSADQLDRLVKQLDANAFKDREAASRELARLGKLARGALEKALKTDPSPELKRRVEELLEKLSGEGPVEDWQRLTRAVEVLEYLGTPEARRIVEKLAEGGAAPPTDEARAALRRWPKP